MTRRIWIPTLLVPLLIVFSATALVARRPAVERNVARALNRADRLYEEGKLERALLWAARARDLIAEELAVTAPLAYRLPSNAAVLLNYLDYYGSFVRGRDPGLDANHDELTAILHKVHSIERQGERPDRWGELDVATWTDGRVHRLGDVNISHWADGRIHQVGRHSIGYWADGRPHRIGDIDYSYRAGSRRPWQVEGVVLP